MFKQAPGVPYLVLIIYFVWGTVVKQQASSYLLEISVTFPPFLAPSIVHLPLIFSLNILQQETSGKLITKMFEGRYEELPALPENSRGDTFTMHPYGEETSIQPRRDWNKMET